MYRSQNMAKAANKNFTDSDIFPICVPSYNRPHPKIVDCADERLPLVFFVRREQLDEYRYLREKFRVVPIDGVSNIGETRAKILKWARVKRYNNIFMLDDDIQQVDYLYPFTLESGNECMRANTLNTRKKGSYLDPTAFKIWMLWLERLDPDVAISSPSYRPDSWHMKKAGADMMYNSGACIQCIHLNVELLHEYNIRYESSDVVGNEDYALQFHIMDKGLKSCILTDLVYNCPPINQNAGGCQGASGYNDPTERYKKYIKLFKNNVSGKDHPGVLTKQTRTGFESIKFNWKYWRDQLSE